MDKGNKIFKTITSALILVNAFGQFGNHEVIAECGAISLLTTAIIWEILLYEQKKAFRIKRKVKSKKRVKA